VLAHVRRSAGGDPHEGLDLLARAMRLSPRDPRTFIWHHFANWCYWRLGDYAAMEAECRRSIGLYGRYAMSWIALASALGLQGRIEESRAAGLELRALLPQFDPDEFFRTAEYFYARRFTGPVRQGYQDLRDVLHRAL
jgi:tetratricopeptide (TPR) repeat protein